MKKWYLFLASMIVGLGLVVRLWGFANRAPFDWDQNRDYQTIAGIAAHKMTLIGPVAKGEGGFFLGPLYYYLATPAFVLLHGNPRALPLTSMALDMLTVVAILSLLPTLLGRKKTLVIASIWSFSWFAIEMSRISWNVVLVPLWSILLLVFLASRTKLSIIKVVLLGFIVGLSWHIHAALIPIGVIALALSLRRLGISWVKIPLLLLGYSIPLIPLIIFDIRHAGLNWSLMMGLFQNTAHAGWSLTVLSEAIFLRLGKNTQSMLTGISAYNLLLGYLTLFLGVIGLFLKHPVYKIAGLLLLLNILAIFYLKEVGFPEYYFALSYFPTLILATHCLFILCRYRTLPVMVVLGLCIWQNLRQYSTSQTTFALSRKESLGGAIVALKTPIDLRLELAPGREGGILPIVKAMGGVIDPQSSMKVLVTDKGEGAVYVNGELTSDIGMFGGIRLAKVVITK